jgi:hypothetical protein
MKNSQRSPSRNRALGAIHIEFARMRRDLDREELRDALHQYAAEVLNLSNVETMADLTDRELGWVLDAMRKETAVKKSVGVSVAPPAGRVVRGKFGGRGAGEVGSAERGMRDAEGAEITHLASEAMVITIAKLMDFLRWDHPEKREQWLLQKFKVRSAKTLSYKKAHSCIRVLLNIAVSRDIKRKVPGAVVSRDMINSGIPDLKRRLGIQ